MGKYISFTTLVRGPLITQAIDVSGAAVPNTTINPNGSTTTITVTTTNAHNLVVGNPILVTCTAGTNWTALSGEYFVNTVPSGTTFTIILRAGTSVTPGTIAIAASNNAVSLPVLIDVDKVFRMSRIADNILGIYLAGIYDNNKVIRVVFNSNDTTGETHNFIMSEIAKCGYDAYQSGKPIYEINSLPGGRTCNFIFTNT